jgi:hypothetical protein
LEESTASACWLSNSTLFSTLTSVLGSASLELLRSYEGTRW